MHDNEFFPNTIRKKKKMSEFKTLFAKKHKINPKISSIFKIQKTNVNNSTHTKLH